MSVTPYPAPGSAAQRCTFGQGYWCAYGWHWTSKEVTPGKPPQPFGIVRCPVALKKHRAKVKESTSLADNDRARLLANELIRDESVHEKAMELAGLK